MGKVNSILIVLKFVGVVPIVHWLAADQIVICLVIHLVIHLVINLVIHLVTHLVIHLVIHCLNFSLSGAALSRSEALLSTFGCVSQEPRHVETIVNIQQLLVECDSHVLYTTCTILTTNNTIIWLLY